MKRLIALFSLFVMVSACQSIPERASEETIASRDARLMRLKPWLARGSLAVDSETQGVINATFTWDARDTGFDIRLIGPLGVSTYRITEDNSSARVTGDNQEFIGDSAEALLLEALGVHVPLENMQEWIVGLQGEATEVQRDHQGRIQRMQVVNEGESRWDVRFERYTNFETLELPRLILVSGPDVEIKMAVRSWSRPAVPQPVRRTIPATVSN